MSLHLGNLSSRTCRDDLERVFQRFGRCTIQVKDKYGFVVYDYPASAEKALKTLHRKRICGEVITLSWSNRQPRALQRFARGRKAYEPPHRKFSVKENVDRRLSSNDRRDYERDSKQADGEGRKLGSSDLVDESTSYHSDDSKGYVGERDHPSNDRHGIGGAGKNHLEDDWWGEQVVDPSSENCLETGIEFDSYEPYQDDDKKESDKHHSLSPLAGSASARKSQERRVTGHNDRLETSDYQKTCYVCGEVGHKMCKCPFDLKRHKFRSQGRPHPGADNVPMKHQESDREPVTSRNHWRLLRHGDAPPAHVAPRGRRKYFSDKKRNRRVYESQDKNHAKRARWPLTSSFHSDYTSSRSQSPSRSLESLAQFPSHSKSKSVTLNKRSPSSSRSSTSRHSGCKPFKCRSASRSMSPTFSSLPAELDRHFSPSSNQRQTDFKDSMVNAVGLAHCQEGKTMVRNGAGASISENITAAMENEFEAGPLKLEEEEMKKDLSEKEDERRHNVSKGSGNVLSYVTRSDDNDQAADNLFPHSVNKKRDSQNEDLVGEHMLAPVSDISLSSNASNSARISSEEMCMVLKHYGLQYPKETEKDLPVENYFGSARSWPWEIKYYRRLKKGPISAENYARRISLNENFGIVDKYIRGSSGWGEQNRKRKILERLFH